MKDDISCLINIVLGSTSDEGEEEDKKEKRKRKSKYFPSLLLQYSSQIS
jgi:hypothetical protein